MSNPVYSREVMRSMRAPRMILSIFIFNMLLFTVGMFCLYSAIEESAAGGQMDYNAVLRLYQLIAGVLLGLMVIMMPVLASGSISGERERNTLDILLSTGMNEYFIVWGKLKASISIIMTLVLSTLPVLSLVFVYGGIRFLGLLKLLLVLSVIAFFIGSICMTFSAFAKTQTFSLICSYVVILIITVGSCLGIYILAGLDADTASRLSFVLYFNPSLTFMIFILNQVGDIGTAASIMERLCIERSTLPGTHFLISSIAFQVLTALVLLIISSRVLMGRGYYNSRYDD